ncbi:MAG TPA: DUF4214 domain-containing protein, partial [Iamia sp.]
GGDDTVDGTPKEIDSVDIIGTDGDDEILLVSPDPETDIATVTNGDWTLTVDGNLGFIVHAGAGDDTVDASGMVVGTSEGIDLWGEAGDDQLVASPHPSALHGGTGTNELVGGAGPDSFDSASATDTFVDVDDEESILDSAGPVGRDLSGLEGLEGLSYSVAVDGNTGIRVQQSGPDAVVTVTGARTGRQVLGTEFDSVHIATHTNVKPLDHAVVEVVALAHHTVDVAAGPGGVIDVIVPTGSWGIGGGEVDPHGPYQSVFNTGGAPTSARSPLADANDRFALRALRDLHAVMPDEGLYEQGGQLLREGAITRTSVAQAFTTTGDFREVQVDGVYAEVLRRSADESGRDYWAGRLADRLLLRKLRASFYGSPEALAQRGGTLPSFVTAVYEEVLSRTPAPSEVAYWVGVIEGGVARGTVADRFLNTPEARTAVIVDRFLAHAGRAPTAAEVETWLPRLGSSSTDGQLALLRSLVASRAAFLRPEV